VNKPIPLASLPNDQLCDAVDCLNALASYVHAQYEHFYRDPLTKEPAKDTIEWRLSKVALMHSELGEMTEGIRKGIPDAHLPHFTAEEVELADLVIRALDYAGFRKLLLGEAFVAKSLYNANRADHKDKARAAEGGKKV
jgi:hypothetical protein